MQDCGKLAREKGVHGEVWEGDRVSGSWGGEQKWGTCNLGRERELGPMKRGNDSLGAVGRGREQSAGGGNCGRGAGFGKSGTDNAERVSQMDNTYFIKLHFHLSFFKKP
jgi:hypothetical protein